MKIKKAVIPAAGYGTRFLPFTKSVAKELLPIIDRPAIDYIVKEAVDSGIEEILIIISERKNNIITYFDRNMELEYFLITKNKKDDLNLVKQKYDCNFYYVRQDEQLGLGHAISLAENFVKDEPFAVLLGDDVFKCEIPATKQLIDLYNKYQTTILGTMLVDKKDTKKYGICSGEKISDDIYKVDLLIEKPEPEKTPSNVAIAGRYILMPEIFKYLRMKIKNKTGEIELTDAILKTISDRDCYCKVIAGKRYDTGSKIGYLDAILDFGLEREDLKEDFLNLLKSKISK